MRRDFEARKKSGGDFSPPLGSGFRSFKSTYFLQCELKLKLQDEWQEGE
jgi:hypothetical protein